MKWVFPALLFLIAESMISCESNPSTVCDHVEPDQLCMDYKTSDIGLQTWHKTGGYFVIDIANNSHNNPYIPQIDANFRLFDHQNGITPQTGSYKGVTLINASLGGNQFDLHLYIDGKEDYTLDLSETSSFEIENITDSVVDGRASCYFKNVLHPTDKKQLNLNFQGAVKK